MKGCPVKNLWKGFVVGGTLGAAIGIAVDGASRARRDVVTAAADADLGSKAHELHDRAVKSDTVKSVTERVHQVSEPIAAALHKASDAVTERT